MISSIRTIVIVFTCIYLYYLTQPLIIYPRPRVVGYILYLRICLSFHDYHEGLFCRSLVRPLAAVFPGIAPYAIASNLSPRYFAILDCQSCFALSHREFDFLGPYRISFNAILTKLHKSICTTVMQMDDPHKIMDSLRSHYSQVNAIAAAHAQRQLFDLKCTDPNKLQDHLDKLLALREKIVEYGTAVPDDVFVGCIILSVPHAYRPIIRASEIAIEALNSSKELQLSN